MVSTKIIRGRFATDKGQKGNFMGQNAKGDNIFISKAMMKSDLSWTKDSDLKFPFHVIFNVQTIGVSDPVTGKIVPGVTDERKTVSYCSLDADERDQIAIADDVTKVNQAQLILDLAVKAGLSVEHAQAITLQATV